MIAAEGWATWQQVAVIAALIALGSSLPFLLHALFVALFPERFAPGDDLRSVREWQGGVDELRRRRAAHQPGGVGR